MPRRATGWQSALVDTVSAERRSQMMARIRSKNTKPELILRRALHSLGLRYRLHQSNLPGKPDIFLRRFNAAIFVNGCFWHGHGCKHAKVPSTNTEFWHEKISRNKARDAEVLSRLHEKGVKSFVVWECEIRSKKINEIMALALQLKDEITEQSCAD